MIEVAVVIGGRKYFGSNGSAFRSQIPQEIELKSGHYFMETTLCQANQTARQKYLNYRLTFVRLDLS